MGTEEVAGSRAERRVFGNPAYHAIANGASTVRAFWKIFIYIDIELDVVIKLLPLGIEIRMVKVQ